MQTAQADWCDDAAYACTDAWDRSAWAWAFLRRNAGYRRDWMAFIAVWRALEADHGAPPDRDMPRWLADPRACVQVPVETAEGCIGAEDRVLIECALGAQWGFYKFPPDPGQGDRTAVDIAWRAVELARIEMQYPQTLTLDLALPLAEQLADARTRLIAAQRVAQREAGLPAPTVSAHRARWRLGLRLLDGQAAGAALTALAAGLFPGLSATEARIALGRLDAEATALTRGGYRRILLLHDA